MEIIATLAEMIGDEIDGASEYVRMANELKSSDPELSKTFYDLSIVEMGHMEILHKQVMRIIEKYRRSNEEPPDAMLALYNILHDKHIKAAACARISQEEYASK